MEFPNWLGGLLKPRKKFGSKLLVRRNPDNKKLRCESLEKRRMLSGVALIAQGSADSAVPQTEVHADPIGDGLLVQGQEFGSSSNLIASGGLGSVTVAAASSPDFSPEYTTINGRNFGYYVPESYDPSTPTPLLFMFHGMGGNSSEQSGGSAENGYYGWQTTAHENGFIVLFPESLGFFKTWDLGAGGSSSDLPFVDDMIDWATTNYNIDTSQVFTTGHSWGAYFSYYVARYRSEDIAAFAAHSGGLGGAFFLGSTPAVPSGPSPTPSLNGIVLHAVDDGIVPYSNSQKLYDDLLANGHNVYDDGIGNDGIIEVDGWGPDNHRYRLQHNQTQWDFFLSVAPDDVPLVLSLAIADASIAEGAGAAATTATVTRSDPRGDLTVLLTSGDTSEATVPATVTMLDGESSVAFDIAAVDDSLVDGTQNVTISAAAAGYTGAGSTLDINDDDVPLVLDLAIADASIAEGAGAAATTATVTRSDPRGDLTVLLTSGDTSEATVPATVTMLDGESSVAFDIAAVDDSLVDGTQNVTISAAAAGYTGAGSTLDINDDDVPLVLSLSISDESIAESAGVGATSATVNRTDVRGDLVVTLSSDDPSEASVPATVILLDGENSATFEIAAVDDSLVDGTQNVTISASAVGYTGDSRLLAVTDENVTMISVMDNGDAGFSQRGFRYQSNAQVVDARGEDNHNLRGDDGWARWTFSDLDDGAYQVSATWAHKYGNKYNAIDAPFSIEDVNSTVLATKTVNQMNTPDEFVDNGSSWDSLATVNVTGGSLFVTLEAGSNSNRYTVADAIRIEKIGDIAPTISLSIADAKISEAAGTATTTVTVTRTHTSGDLVVSLASDDLSEATVPATVTIADGQNSTTFDITTVDDNVADGTQLVAISATALGYAPGNATLEVTDDEASLVAVVDNLDVGFSQSGFRYQDNQQVAAAYGGDNYSLRGDSGTASWNFVGLDDGIYQVAATWAHKYNNKYNAVDATFELEDASGSLLATKTVNQQNAPSEFAYEGSTWDNLATVQVTDGNLVVRLGPGSNPNQYAVADAIRVERISTLDRAAELDLVDAVFDEM